MKPDWEMVIKQVWEIMWQVWEFVIMIWGK